MKRQIKTISVILIFSFFFQNVVLALTPETEAIMLQGESIIGDFFSPSSYDYFGKKVESFYSDENLSLIKQKSEENAKATNRSTEKVYQEIMRKDFENWVFSDLLSKLKVLISRYREVLIKTSPNDPKISTLDTILISSGTFVAILGLAAIVLMVWGSMTATVAGLWAAFMVWWYGTNVGWAAAWAALYGGPWGWIIAGGLVVSLLFGIKYYQTKKEAAKKECIEKCIKEITAKRPDILFKWRQIFM